MNSLFLLCPDCGNQTQINIDKNNIDFQCQCSYNLKKKCKDYFKSFKKERNNQITQSLQDIINDVNQGKEHLRSYFTTLKNEHINQLISTINAIESSYEDSYNRNMNMLAFIDTLIDNYDESDEMKKVINNNKVNIYQ